MTTLAKLKTKTTAHLSDWRLYSMLIQGLKLNELELYKACVAVSAHGNLLPQADGLNAVLKNLLEVRRLNHLGFLDQSQELLERLKRDVHGNSFFMGEISFLKGIIFNRTGTNEAATEYFQKAHQIYVSCDESHRALRSLINAKICERDLESTIHGDLLALEQEARRLEFYDLVGNIAKARSIELGGSGSYEAAYLEADVAVKNYKLDGFPEDHDLALCLSAIFGHLCGQTTNAAWAFHEIKSQGGKLQAYIDAYQSLLAGRRPVLANGHPLHGLKWEIQKKKTDSITGKILKCLQNGPATRDEIIVSVWGAHATDPSYNARFFSALTQLRRVQKVAVIFDGTRYLLAR